MLREPDVYKALELGKKRNDLAKRFAESFKGAAEDLERAINGSPWKFKCDNIVCHGRNDDLFALLIGDSEYVSELHLLHRKRDTNKLDLWFEYGVSRDGAVTLRQNVIDNFYGYTRLAMLLHLPKKETEFETRFMLLTANREDGQSVYDRISPLEVQPTDYQKFRRLVDLVVSLSRKK